MTGDPSTPCEAACPTRRSPSSINISKWQLWAPKGPQNLTYYARHPHTGYLGLRQFAGFRWSLPYSIQIKPWAERAYRTSCSLVWHAKPKSPCKLSHSILGRDKPWVDRLSCRLASVRLNEGPQSCQISSLSSRGPAEAYLAGRSNQFRNKRASCLWCLGVGKAEKPPSNLPKIAHPAWFLDSQIGELA